MEPGLACMPAHGSPVACSRPGTVATVNCTGSASSSSSHSSGQETVAAGSARGL